MAVTICRECGQPYSQELEAEHKKLHQKSQLHCGCCQIPVDGIEHFDTTEHHLKALEEWCKMLEDSHHFGKGYANEPGTYERNFLGQILTTKLILFNRGIEKAKIDSIIDSHFSKCKHCGIIVPKDIDKTLLEKRIKLEKDVCPDCYHDKKKEDEDG